jgi:hypothetical protein
MSRAAVLDGCPPGDVLAAMEALADSLLEALAPGGKGARVLQAVGLLAAREAAQATTGDESP